MRRRSSLVVLVLVAACSNGSTAAPRPSPSLVPSDSPTTTAATADGSPVETPSATPSAVPAVTKPATAAASATPRATAAPTKHAAAAPAVTAQAVPVRPYSLRKLGGFSSPVWAGAAPGDSAHLYLVEKSGRLLQLDSSGRRLGTVLDLTTQVSTGNEQGLLSVAFDPRYASNHKLYVDYTNTSGDTRVVSYVVSGGKAGSPKTLLSVDQPYDNHNGGLLLFDRTGNLLVGMGDGGSGGDPGDRAQNLGSDLGKILRINPTTGAGAAGNPFSSHPKVWAYGLRNPWRFSFDTNGDLYIGDVGQSEIEELDVVVAGRQSGVNYGWSVYEGTKRFKSNKRLTSGGRLVMPALEYTHASGGCSITGGEVYRGSARPELRGTYVFGDYCAGVLLKTRRTSSGVARSSRLGPKVDGLQSFGHDARGELLVLSSDSLYRLV